jgi:apolipoprotein N-acyltransferase
MIAFSNACFALGFLRESEHIEARKEKEKKKFKFKPNVAAAIGASVMALNFLFGLFFMLYYVDDGEDIPVAVIQGNISSVEKWRSYSVRDCCDIYCDLTRKAVEENGAKIVVWPETVINVQIDSAEVIKNQISELSVECDAYIVVGTFSNKTDGEGREETYNSQYLFLPDGRVSETVYSKRKLVPFGEYMPMGGLLTSVLPTISDVNIMQNDLEAGTDSEIFDTVYGKIGGIICFDSIYDSIVRDSVRDGAQLIALSTNDSWYRDSAAVYQHNKHAVLRAVENGRYLLRAANTGISSIISPTGEVIKSVDALKEGYICEDIVFRNSATPYARVGNVIVFFSAILMGVFIAFKYTFVQHDKKEDVKPVNNKKKVK